MIYMSKIGDYIKEERKKAGLTQSEFAMRSGLGLRFIRELEQGKGLVFHREHELTPAELIGELPGGDRTFFNLLFAGGAVKKIYRLFEFGTA